MLNRLMLPAVDRVPVGENDVTLSECPRSEPIFVLREVMDIVSVRAWDADVLTEETLDFLASARGILDVSDPKLDSSLRSLFGVVDRLPVARRKRLTTPDDSEVLDGDRAISTWKLLESGRDTAICEKFSMPNIR